ncbi:MAG: pantoate--beta-alanine ligase [Rhodocyclales bacterium]|nr:pantoate--beta-alanine ligase [Rhodocyclales bacterium]
MQVHDTIASLRTARAAVGNTTEPAQRVAVVPTMGNLHAGHISLMRQAREHADVVIATIFVNRLQFRPGEDFEKYPRTFAADCAQLEAAGVDHLFAPDEAEMYPQQQTYYVEPPTAQIDILDGEFRPGHFRGMATVVLKLLNITQPDVALFGKKDYQQLMVIRNMVADFNLPIKIMGGETIRAEDGLALSSRNGYLSATERLEAPRLFQVLNRLVAAVRGGETDFSRLEQDAMAELQAHGWLPEYVALRKKLDLQFAPAHESGLVVLAAARLGSTRLIDNLEV